MASKRKEKKFNDLIAREREKSLAKLASSPDLVNERVNLDSISQSQESSNLKTKSGDLNPIPPEWVAYSNTFCLCTDNQGILGSVEDCHKIIDAIENLARIICPEELKKYLELIKVCVDKIKTFEDKIAIETYTLYIKAFTLNIVYPTYYGFLRVLDYAQSKQLKSSEIKELIKNKKINLNLSLADASESDIQNIKTDLSDVLESISRFFPEFKVPDKKNLIIEPRLFTESKLAKTSTSLITDTFYSFCISRSLSFQTVSEKLSVSRKTFNIGSIDILLQEAKTAILDNYGEDTFKVFITLVAYWYKKSKNFEKITVSGSDILSYFNKKYEKIERNKKRVKKVDNLRWLAHQCELIDSLRVYSSNISPSGGNPFNIERTYLIEFPKISYAPHQIDIYGEVDLSTITDIQITFKVGDWFKYFDDKKHCVQFGYIHQKALSSSGMLSNFLHWISMKSRQNQKGNFKVKTVLEDIGLKKVLEEILTTKGSGYKAKDLFNSFNRMIAEAQSIEDLPQIIIYDPPKWTGRKPNGWFKQWLNQVINIKESKYSETHTEAELSKKSAPKKETQTLLSVDGLTKVLDEYKSNPNVSLRKIAQHYGTSQPTLSRKIKAKKLTQQQLKDLINIAHFLAKKKP